MSSSGSAVPIIMQLQSCCKGFHKYNAVAKLLPRALQVNESPLHLLEELLNTQATGAELSFLCAIPRRQYINIVLKEGAPQCVLTA
jgi:hypothetical protein